MALDQEIQDNQEPKPQQPPSFDEFEDKVSESLKIPRNLIRSLTTQESGGNPDARSNRGAAGRWQVMPATFEETKKRLNNPDLDPSNPYDNIYVGAHYLKKQFDDAPKDLPNEGSKWAYALSKYHGGGMDANGNIRAVSDGKTTTDKYVDTVMNRWRSLNEAGQEAGQQPAQQQSPAPSAPVKTAPPVDLNQGRVGKNGEFILQAGETTKNDQLADQTPAVPVQGTIGTATRGMLTQQGRIRPATDVELANPGASQHALSIPGEAGRFPTEQEALHQLIRSLGGPQGFEELYKNNIENPFSQKFTPEYLNALQKAGHLRFDPESNQWQLNAIAPNSIKAQMDNYAKQQTDLNAVQNPSLKQAAQMLVGGLAGNVPESLLTQKNAPNVIAGLENGGAGLAKGISNAGRMLSKAANTATSVATGGNAFNTENRADRFSNSLDRFSNNLGSDVAGVSELDKSKLGQLSRGLIAGSVTMPMINELAHAGGLPAVLAHGVVSRSHLPKEDQIKGFVNDVATMGAMHAANEMPGIVQAGVGGAAQTLGRMGTGDVRDLNSAVPAFLEGVAMSPAARQRRGVEMPSIASPEGVRFSTSPEGRTTDIIPIDVAKAANADLAVRQAREAAPAEAPAPETPAPPAAAKAAETTGQQGGKEPLGTASRLLAKRGIIAPEETAPANTKGGKAKAPAPTVQDQLNRLTDLLTRHNNGEVLTPEEFTQAGELSTKLEKTFGQPIAQIVDAHSKGEPLVPQTTGHKGADALFGLGVRNESPNESESQPGAPERNVAGTTEQTQGAPAVETQGESAAKSLPVRPDEPAAEPAGGNVATGTPVETQAEEVGNETKQSEPVGEPASAEKPPVVAGTPGNGETGTEVRTEGGAPAEAPAAESGSANLYAKHGIEIAPEIAADIDRRANLKKSEEKGSLGKLGSIGRQGLIPAGQENPLRSLAEHPAIRQMLGLPEISPEVYEKSTADWGKMTDHTMDALAEKAGVPRSSRMDEEALNRVEQFIGDHFDPKNPEHQDLAKVYGETRAAVDMTHNKVDAFFDSEPFKTVLAEAQAKLDKTGSLRGKEREALVEALQKAAEPINQNESLGRVRGKSSDDVTTITDNAIKGLVKDLKNGRLSGRPEEWLGRRFKEHTEKRNSVAPVESVPETAARLSPEPPAPEERPSSRSRRTPVTERPASGESGVGEPAQTEKPARRGRNAGKEPSQPQAADNNVQEGNVGAKPKPSRRGETSESGYSSLPNDVANLINKAIKGATGKDLETIGQHFREAAGDFVQWGKAMMRDFGAQVRPHLRKIWDGLKDFYAAERGTNNADFTPLESRISEDKAKKVNDKLKENIPVAEDFDIRKYARQVDKLLQGIEDKAVNGKNPKQRAKAEKQRLEGEEAFSKLIDAYQANDGKALVEAQTKLKDALGSKYWAVADFMRPLNATGELSVLLRQGYLVARTHPIVWYNAVMKATATHDGAMEFLARAQADPDMPLMKATPLDLPMLNEANLSKHALSREENTLGRWPEKIPVVGKFFGGLERINKTGIEGMRMGLFKTIKQAAEARGAKMWDTDAEGNRVASAAAIQIAKEVNILTGRGNISDSQVAQTIADVGSLVAYSPRFMISRFQALDPTRLYRVYKQSPEVFKSVAADYAKTVVADMAIAGALAAAGFRVSLDPDDADFLKVKIGNVKIPIPQGGMQPAIRFTAKMGKRGYELAKAGIKGEDMGKIAQQAGQNIASFGRQKLAPIASVGVDQIFDRRDETDAVTGKKVNMGHSAIGTPVSGLRDFAEHFLPMYYQQAIETAQNGGMGPAIATAVPEFFGLTAGYYDTGRYGENLESSSKAKLRRDWSYEKGPEPMTRYQGRVKKADQLYNDAMPQIKQSSFYQSANDETKQRMEETLTRRIKDLTYDENPNTSKISPSAIISSVRSGDVRRETTRKKNLRKAY